MPIIEFNTILTNILKFEKNQLVIRPLDNVGNTCYINCVLQVLFNIINTNINYDGKIIFNKIILNHNYDHIFSSAKFFELLLMYSSSSSSSSSGSSSNSNTIDLRQHLSDFRVIIGKFNNSFSGQEHKDAHELLLYLINCIHESMGEQFKNEELLLKRCTSEESYKSFKSSMYSFSTKNYLESFVTDKFSGQMLLQTKCNKCNNVSNMYEIFNILELPLEPNTSEISGLKERFEYFSKITLLDKYFCNNCQILTEAYQKRTLHILPDILFISLNRFVNLEKETSNFYFTDNNINLIDFKSNPADKNQIYKLVSMICHYGSIDHGHYISRIKDLNNEWLEINDDNISKWDNKTNGSEIYILVYRGT